MPWCSWTQTWEKGAKPALAERAAHRIAKERRPTESRRRIAKERRVGCAGGEGCAHWCWEGESGGVHGLTVLRFCPEAQSLARRLNAQMGPWASGESACMVDFDISPLILVR